jgi:hypothetical protein
MESCIREEIFGPALSDRVCPIEFLFSETDYDIILQELQSYCSDAHAALTKLSGILTFGDAQSLHKFPLPETIKAFMSTFFTVSCNRQSLWEVRAICADIVCAAIQVMDRSVIPLMEGKVLPCLRANLRYECTTAR